jgi:hypothetical protein
VAGDGTARSARAVSSPNTARFSLGASRLVPEHGTQPVDYFAMPDSCREQIERGAIALGCSDSSASAIRGRRWSDRVIFSQGPVIELAGK